MNIPVTDQMGALLAVFGALAVAFESILVRKYTVKGSIRELIGIVILVNAMIWSGLAIFYYYPNFNISTKSVIAFLLSGIFGFFLGYVLFFTSIKRIGASKTMPIIRTQVIVALVLSIIFLGETLIPFHLVGICIMIIGTILVSREISGDDDPDATKSRWTGLLIPLAGGVSWGLNWFFTRLGL
ncbi:MAG: DMT family transporter, partial [Thermoplasmata archaeon]